MALALTLRSLTSTLFPQRTMGIPSHTRVRSPVVTFGRMWGRTVPVGHVFVGDTGGHVKHDDTTLPWELETRHSGQIRVPPI